MKLQRLIAAPIAFGLIIGNFPSLTADAKNVNLSAPNTSFNIAMDTNQDAKNGENTPENKVAEAPESEESSTENQNSEQSKTEESSTENQISETPENEETSDTETTVEEPAEVIEESEPSQSSEKCPNGGEHINIGGIVSISNCHKLENSDSSKVRSKILKVAYLP